MSYVTALVYFYTAISLVALALSVPMVAQLFDGRVSRRWGSWFLVMAVATSVTGFLFPFSGVTPAFATGLVALAILGLVVAARYGFHLQGHWRWIYASGMVASAYLLAFVGVVQAFQKLPFLNGFAPTQTELPFVVAQVGTLLGFAALGLLAALKFKGMVAEAMESQRVT
jgi:hypothetical protein